MNHEHLCVFDLDGTFYPKESEITQQMRHKVICTLAKINNVSIQQAQWAYMMLPSKYPNPYDGLASLNMAGDVYQQLFNELPIETIIGYDERLVGAISKLAQEVDIYILSLAPMEYIKRMLRSLGIDAFVSRIISVSPQNDYAKDRAFFELRQTGHYKTFVSVGDDMANDILPAESHGFETYHVDFSNDTKDIYHVVEALIDRFKRIAVPPVMRVENISYCNEKCIICPYSGSTRKPGIMKQTLFEKLVLEHTSVAHNPKLIFPASIGEPLLDNLFFDRVAFARKVYSSIAVFTNSSLLDDRAFRHYIDAGGTELMLTLHGYNRAMHKFITKTDTYDTVRNNIKNAAKVNDELGHPIKIFLDIYADNSDECQNFVNEMTRFGVLVQRLDLSKIHNWGGKVNCFSQRIQPEFCSRIYKQFGVQYDGSVVPCCIDTNGDYKLGNADSSSLAEIFSSDQYKRLTQLEKLGLIRTNALCSQCNI